MCGADCDAPHVKATNWVMALCLALCTRENVRSLNNAGMFLNTHDGMTQQIHNNCLLQDLLIIQIR